MDKSIRAAQLADQIRDYLAVWTKQDLPGYIFTITHVTLEPDLRTAHIWVSCLVASQQPGIIKSLQKLRGEYQRKLNKLISRHSVPHISFVAGGSESSESLLSQLSNQ